MNNSATDNFFQVRDLKKTLADHPVLKGLNLDIPRGKNTVILGQSGEGKSVFLKHLTGLIKPDSGSIRVDGTDITALSERQLNPIRKKIGILFQDGALFDSMTVAENVVFPLIESGIRKRKTLLEKAEEALALVGLEKHMSKMPVNISGGMRKRVALARAMITKPGCILYDEPTAGLDPIVADSIDHLVRRLGHELHITSVIVTHDIKSMRYVADQVAVLRDGKTYFEGTPDELHHSGDQSIQNFLNGVSRESHGI